MTRRPKRSVAEPHRLDQRLHRLVHRAGDDRGASLVEYSLIFALVLVSSIGATKYLATKGSSQVQNQATCISTRPPPTNCVQGVASTTTSTTGVGPTTTTSLVTTTTAGPTTTAVAVTQNAPTGGTYTHGSTGPPAVQASVNGTTVTIHPASGTMTSGSVQFKVKQLQNGAPISIQYVNVTCTTSGSDLSCVLPSTPLQYVWQTGMTLEVSVNSATTTPATTVVNTTPVAYP